MNQTKKRLAIIQLAISITDIETIKLQTLRLELLRSDNDIDDILKLLNNKNYVQAQSRISEYIDTPNETIVQRIPKDRQTIIDEFKFLSDKIQQTDESSLNQIEESIQEKTTSVAIETEQETEQETIEKDIKEESVEEEKVYYPAIINIHHILQDIKINYPPVYLNNKYSEKLDYWLKKLSQDGYTEEDIEELLMETEVISDQNKPEAGQLLLLASATKSKYAQFILARELYKGTLLQRNLEESFSLMSKLAFKDKYPEALCDLGQFYENGIGVNIDKEQAKYLYKEAMHFGIKRAKVHFEKLDKSSKSLLSIFKK